MNLIIDIGNTRVKTGIFKKGKLIKKNIFKNPVEEEFQSVAYNQKIENVILATVRGIDKKAENFLKKNFYFLKLTKNTPLPIINTYKTPKTLGKDRLASAVGAFYRFPKRNCLIIDAGTCITMDILTKKGEFLGGNISPGIDMRLQAMNAFTANLPLVKRKKQKEVIGFDTESAVRNGGQLGALLEIQAFIKLSKKKYSNLKVIFTGGDEEYFVKNLKTKIFADSNLVLTGLNKILEYNVKKK